MFLSWTGIEFCQWFSCICSDDLVIFILHFVPVVYHIDLWVLSNLCVPGINPTWWLCVVLFLYCWIELLWVCSNLSWFLEYFEKDRYSYLFYIFCRLPLWRHLILDLFLLGSYFCLIYYKFNFTDSSILFKLSVSSWFSIVRLYVSRNLFIASRLSDLLGCNFIVFTYFLYLCSISCYFFSFILYFIWILFLLVSLTKGLSILFMFWKI